MFHQLRPALILFALQTILTGILYPLVVTGLAQASFPNQANGSLVERDGVPIGSVLIGQDFSDPRYFWPRPSATSGSPYAAFDPQALTGSAGSNLGPLSQTLMENVRRRVEVLRAADPGNPFPIPIDLVTTSASGLDPHISIAAAYFQVPRVARLRGLPEADVIALIDRYTEGRTLGFLGEPRVNILLLDLALDGIK